MATLALKSIHDFFPVPIFGLVYFLPVPQRVKEDCVAEGQPEAERQIVAEQPVNGGDKVGGQIHQSGFRLCKLRTR